MNVKGKRLYIAGPMGGQESWGFPNFERAYLFLEACGATAVAPHRIDQAVWGFNGKGELPERMVRGDVLLIDLAILRTCDAIYMLAGWSKSAGAILERQWANNLGLEVLYAPDAERGCVGVLLEPTWEVAYVAELELALRDAIGKASHHWDADEELALVRERASQTGLKPKNKQEEKK